MLAVFLDQGVAADVALVLKDVEHAASQLGRGRRDLGALAHRGVLDARDHVAEGIVEGHRCSLPYQLDLTRPGTWPAEPRSRSAIRLIFSLR